MCVGQWALCRGEKLCLRVHACVTVCEHLVGGRCLSVSGPPTAERAGDQSAASQDGDPCVSSEGERETTEE